MNRLPSEIIHEIFIQLPFEDRIKCTLVCRHWYNSLQAGSLFYEVTIKDTRQFNNFIDLLKIQPNYAPQVEILKHTDLKPFDKRKLCNMLPNLREIEYFEKSFTSPCTTLCSQPFELLQSNSKLESIVEWGECELTRHLLKFGSFNRLKHLELMLIQVDNPIKEVFSRLKSAPVLKSMHICYCNMGIEDIEVIHENTPALETLKLTEMTLIATEIPKNIIPVTSVTALTIVMFDIEDDPMYLDLYKYLEKKYTNLATFDYDDRTMYYFNSLKSMKIYRNGLFPFFRKFGAVLPFYYFTNFPAELNPFATFDEFGIRVPKLFLKNNGNSPIFEQLARSNQSKQVEALDIQHTTIDSPMMLQQFTSLREVYITATNVNLTDYFNAFPVTLTTFTARLKDAKINKLPSRQNNVQYLSLHCEMMYPKLGESISNYFPKLNELYLEGGVAENLSINLPNNHFIHLGVQVHCNGEPSHGFSITNTSCPDSQYFIVKDQNKDTIAATAIELQDRVIISLNYDTANLLHCDKLKLTL